MKLLVWVKAVRLEVQVLFVVTFEQCPFSEPGMSMKFVKIGPQDSVMIKAYIDEQLGMSPGTGIKSPDTGYSRAPQHASS